MVVIPVLAGALAIGVETGELYRVKHQMQGAADSAALAYVYDVIKTNSASASADALYEAQRNGFTNGTNTVTVTVNTPPTQGSNINTPGAVEVVVTKTQNLTFASVLNKASSGYALTARSVAIPVTTTTTTTTNVTTTSTNTTSGGCLVALTPLAEQGVSFASFGNFTSDCLILSNSIATGTGSSASVNMTNFGSATLARPAGIWTRGTFSVSSYGSMTPAASAALQNQTSTIVDPYASLATPSPGTCTQTNYRPSGGSSISIPAGTYCNGMTVSGFSSVYFQPGTYYITNGDLVVSGGSTVSCPTCTGTAGTTFVLTQTSGNNASIGGVNISSESTITLNAPTVTAATSTYAYPGVLFFQDRRATVGTMASTSKIFTLSSLSTATLSGAIYFPNNAIRISSISSSGSNSSNGCTVWIGRYIHFESYSSNYVAGCTTVTGTTVTGTGGYATTTTTTAPVTNTTISTKATLVQ